MNVVQGVGNGTPLKVETIKATSCHTTKKIKMGIKLRITDLIIWMSAPQVLPQSEIQGF